MPDRSTSQQSHQQLWTPDQREQILSYINKRAHDAIDEKGLDAEIEARDRALVAVLAFTGVRGSEIFHSEHDNRTGHQGIRWCDVDLEEQTISVLGKNQQRQSAWLLKQAIHAVERYRTISDPPSDNWPVFPTSHAPSLYEGGYLRHSHKYEYVPHRSADKWRTDSTDRIDGHSVGVLEDRLEVLTRNPTWITD